MPNIARVDEDGSEPHDGTPADQRKFESGSPNVFLNGKAIVRVSDPTKCGDIALTGSGTVFANGLSVHRKGDVILSHDDNEILCESGSPTVFAG